MIKTIWAKMNLNLRVNDSVINYLMLVGLL